MTSSEVLEIYKDTYIKLKKLPTLSDLHREGVTERQIRNTFKSLSGLVTEAKKEFPEVFENLIDSEFLSPKNFKKIKEELVGFKKFVITTAVNGCEVHQGFLESIYNYCEIHNAALIILPSNDPAHNLQNKYAWDFDPVVKKHLVFDDLRLNSNLFISCIKLGAKQIDPITGLARIGQRNGSFIYASPKQRLKYVAVGNNKMPHALMTTGALTRPDYKTTRFFSERTAYIATEDHVLGAIVVELENNNLFHFRQIQADQSGAFIDLAKKYSADSVEPCTPEAIILGDLHSGETDPVAVHCFEDLIKETKPTKIVIHDAFSGVSCNPHQMMKTIQEAKNPLNLSDEFKTLSKDLSYISTLAKEIIVVKSNHDIFLDRYLDSGLFIQHKHNYKLCLELCLAMLDNHNPIKFALENKFDLKNKHKFTWLSRDDDYKIAGIQIAAHGDCGPNGSKGNLKGSELSYQNCVVGHSHSAEILRDSWCVGTLTYLKLNYNIGPSSWTQTSCLVYKNGSRQLINCINGKYKS